MSQPPYYPPPQVYSYGPPPAYGAPPAAPPAYGGYPAIQGAQAPYGGSWSAPPGSAPSASAQPPRQQQGQWPPQAAAPAQYTPVPYPVPGAYAATNKKAVLVGCAYPGTSSALNGCLNDAKCLQHLLVTRFGFADQNIIMLKDDVYHPDFLSTRANINRAIQWLMTGMTPGSSLFFSFSGHGSQKQDMTGDEEDGLDETILPTDYKTAGQIVDDELNQLLVRPLLPGVTLHAVIDACHSGTVLDLPYRTKLKRGQGMIWKGRHRPDKATSGGTCLQFGACRDSQVAQDTNRLSGNVHTGAATFSFIQAIERGGVSQSYAQLLAAMSVALEGSGGAPTSGVADMVMGLLLGGGMTSLGQTPVLSCDKPLDLNTRLMF